MTTYEEPLVKNPSGPRTGGDVVSDWPDVVPRRSAKKAPTRGRNIVPEKINVANYSIRK